MNNNHSIFTIIGVILLAIYNIGFFILKPEELHHAGWISYAFTNLAFILFSISPLLEKQYVIANMKVVTASIIGVYLLITLVFGVIIIAFNPIHYKLVLVVHIILLGINVILVIINIMANIKTDSRDNRSINIKQ